MRHFLWLILLAVTGLPVRGETEATPVPLGQIEVSTLVPLGGMTVQFAEAVAVERLYQQAAASLPKAAIVDHTVRDGVDQMEVAFLGASGITLSNLRYTRTIAPDGEVMIEARASVAQDLSLAEKQLDLYYSNDAAKREVARLARELDEKQRQIDALLRRDQGDSAQLAQPARLIADIQAIRKRQVVGAITTTTGTIGDALSDDRTSRNALLWSEAQRQAATIAALIGRASTQYLESCADGGDSALVTGLIHGAQLPCQDAILSNLKVTIATQLYGERLADMATSDLSSALVYQGKTFADVVTGVRYPPDDQLAPRDRLLNPAASYRLKGAQFSPFHYYDLATFAGPIDAPRCDDLAVDNESCQQAYHPVARLLLSSMTSAMVNNHGETRSSCPELAGIVSTGGLGALRGQSSSCAKAMTTLFGGFELELTGAGDSQSTVSLYYPLAFLSVFRPERVALNHAAGEAPTKLLGAFLLKPMEITVPDSIHTAHTARLMIINPTFR